MVTELFRDLSKEAPPAELSNLKDSEETLGLSGSDSELWDMLHTVKYAVLSIRNTPVSSPSFWVLEVSRDQVRLLSVPKVPTLHFWSHVCLHFLLPQLGDVVDEKVHGAAILGHPR